MKINLASGQRPFPEPWVNVDLIEQFDSSGTPYKLDVKSDIRKLPFDDNSADVMVAHHCFEHILLNDTLDTSREWHRVLKPGGKLVVYVPNIKALAEAWLSGRIDNFIFFVNMYGAYQGHFEDTHKWGYNFQELRDRMSGWDGNSNSLQWSSVREIGPHDTSGTEFSGAALAYDYWILAVEFVK